MEIDITEIIVSLIGLLSVVVTSVVIPLIKSKLTNSQWESIHNYALAGVQAAEILLKANDGAQKFVWVRQYIEEQCKKHGVKIDADTVQIAIENAWKELGFDNKAPAVHN